MALCTCGTETANTSGTHEITTSFQWGSIFSFLCNVWRTLFVLFLFSVFSNIDLRLIMDMQTFKTKVSVFLINSCLFIKSILGLFHFHVTRVCAQWCDLQSLRFTFFELGRWIAAVIIRGAFIICRESSNGLPQSKKILLCKFSTAPCFFLP